MEKGGAAGGGDADGDGDGGGLWFGWSDVVGERRDGGSFAARDGGLVVWSGGQRRRSGSDDDGERPRAGSGGGLRMRWDRGSEGVQCISAATINAPHPSGRVGEGEGEGEGEAALLRSALLCSALHCRNRSGSAGRCPSRPSRNPLYSNLHAAHLGSSGRLLFHFSARAKAVPRCALLCRAVPFQHSNAPAYARTRRSAANADTQIKAAIPPWLHPKHTHPRNLGVGLSRD